MRDPFLIGFTLGWCKESLNVVLDYLENPKVIDKDLLTNIVESSIRAIEKINNSSVGE